TVRARTTSAGSCARAVDPYKVRKRASVNGVDGVKPTEPTHAKATLSCDEAILPSMPPWPAPADQAKSALLKAPEAVATGTDDVGIDEHAAKDPAPARAASARAGRM